MCGPWVRAVLGAHYPPTIKCARPPPLPFCFNYHPLFGGFLTYFSPFGPSPLSFFVPNYLNEIILEYSQIPSNRSHLVVNHFQFVFSHYQLIFGHYQLILNHYKSILNETQLVSHHYQLDLNHSQFSLIILK